MVFGDPLEIADLFLALGFEAGHHIFKTQIALGRLALGLPDPGRVGTGRTAAGALARGASRAGGPLGRGQGALDGKGDLAILPHIDNLHLYRLPFAEHGGQVMDELIGYLGNMYHSGLAFRQSHKGAEFLHAGDFPLQHGPYLKLQTY